MRRTIAVFAVTLLLLTVPDVGRAQTSVEVEGTIQAVDCASQTVVLSGPGGANVVNAGPYTAVLLDATSVPLCTLRGYIGAYATAWLVAGENTFTATRIDVYVSAAPAPPSPAYVAVPSLAGIVLGTIVVAGLVYLLVRGHDGRFYHYPYYGPYYRTYYRPAYRPYSGPLGGVPAYRYGPYRRCRDGAWSRWCL